MATFFNQATLSYSGGTVNSNVTSGEIIEVLTITKTAVVDEYTPNDTITYAVNIVNAGDTPFNGLSLSDDLGADTFNDTVLQPLDYVEGSVTVFEDGVLQADPAVTAGPPLVITALSVPANGVTTVLYTVRANAFAPPVGTGTIDNTVTLSGGITPITATETVSAAQAPELSIEKSVSPTTVTENGQITYTFVIRNSGNTAATVTDAVVVTDTFDPILSDITVTFNGETWNGPDDYTYNETTGVFATETGAITVPAATFTRDPVSGAWIVDPGEVTLTVTGTI